MEATLQTLLFWFFSILAIGGGVGLILQKNPIYAALCLIINFFSLGGLFLTLNAEFLAVIQILVYAGAIMVLFLFVIMLLNLTDEPGAEKVDVRRGLAFFIGAAFVAEMFYVLRGFAGEKINPSFSYGQVEPIGRELLTTYLFPFEMISVILLSALIGAI
ncbi:MAG: NADH-quinone oxidoreductase subunit J, partial [Bacteroidota bacterium]